MRGRKRAAGGWDEQRAGGRRNAAPDPHLRPVLCSEVPAYLELLRRAAAKGVRPQVGGAGRGAPTAQPSCAKQRPLPLLLLLLVLTWKPTCGPKACTRAAGVCLLSPDAPRPCSCC